MKQIIFSFCLLVAVALTGCRKDTEPEGFRMEWKDGELTVRLQSDRKSVRWDETLTVHLEAEYPEDTSVKLPDWPADSGSFFCDADNAVSTGSRLTENGTMVTACDYLLDVKLVRHAEEQNGERRYELPPLDVVCRTKEGPVHTVKTDAVPIDVQEPTSEEWKQLQDIDDTIGLEIQGMSPQHGIAAGWYGIAGGVMLLCVAVWYWLKRRRSRCLLSAAVPSPKEIALAALEKLVAENLIGRGELKPFYQRISGILRDYLEGELKLNAPERTTEEFLEDLRKDIRTLNAEQKGLLEEFLKHCDLVKFATYQPDSVEIQKTVDVCREFVMETSAKPLTEDGVHEGRRTDDVQV